MRILVYGMQSSGASLVTFLLAQMERTVAVVDLFYHQVAPRFTEPQHADHIVVKAVITNEYDLGKHMENFEPDMTLFVVRHPDDNYVALNRKDYRNFGGRPDEKLRIAEEVFNNPRDVDSVVQYEGLLLEPTAFVSHLSELGLPLLTSHLDFPRSREDVLSYNQESSEWCRSQYRRAWSFGNIRDQRIRPDMAVKYVPRRVKRRVEGLSPNLRRQSEDFYRVRGIDRAVGPSVMWTDLSQEANRRIRHTIRRARRRVARTAKRS